MVESPGGAGSVLGEGLDYLFERQGNLDIRSIRSVVTLRDLAHGTVSTTILDSDPALLSRKFNIEVKSSGPGAQLPFALPGFHLLGARIYPSVILQAAAADTTVDFHDKPEPDNSDSLAARGPMYGAGFDLLASFCNTCRWFGGVGYRFRSQPSTAADRSPGFVAPGGFTVQKDAVRLSRTGQDLSARLGYTFPGNHVSSYVGVRRRTTSLDIQDEVGYTSAGEETSLSSRSKFKSKGSETILGLDAHLGGPVFGRAEFAFGDREKGGLLKLVYLKPSLPFSVSLGATSSPENSFNSTRSSKERERREKVLAPALALRLKRVLDEFSAARERLPTVRNDSGSAAYPRGAVADLLNPTEKELLAALEEPGLAAMRDFVEDLFAKARADLEIGRTETSALLPSSSIVAVRFSPDPAPDAAGTTGERKNLDKQRVDSWTDKILAAIETMWMEATRNDLLITLCIKSTPRSGARFSMHPLSYTPPVLPTSDTNSQLVNVWRGLYQYGVTLQKWKSLDGKLDLVMDSRPILVCPLIAESAADTALLCGRHEGDPVRECP